LPYNNEETDISTITDCASPWKTQSNWFFVL
jgi:hypothetical protein